MNNKQKPTKPAPLDSSMASTLPSTMQALVQEVYAEPLKVKDIATPEATPGAAIVRVEIANIVSYMRDIYNGKRKYPYPTPLVVGSSALGRVVAVGPDATSLQPGQLVFVDAVIRGRDDPGAVFLSGVIEGGSEGSKKLMRGEWRNSTFAQYVKAPLECCIPLDEKKLTAKPEDGGQGYDLARLAYVSMLLVPFGGFRSINVQPGETVIIAPATGGFGGAAVHMALALGARVIALGRNTESLAKLKKLSDRVETVRMTGNLDEEIAALAKIGKADAFLDISPPAAANSTHMKASILSLRHGGRVSLMGGIRSDVSLPYHFIMRNDITIKVSAALQLYREPEAKIRIRVSGCMTEMT